ncbi:DUF695 domain-containing protein [Blastopirellula marina]|uniref:DUF695 domain-containing protein n=1 Tax=Blastopirellula marina TaxID=124 RepID=A0A2S8GHU9_9BACT|nr:DUF695 domain-containing protein [Blastopirellula marina]PQO44032.1 hypothetical protein C5Y93_21050 [Blastopirellula marina]
MSDNWDSYPFMADDAPGTNLVDLGIAEVAPIAELGEIAYLQLTLCKPTEDGLSSDEEFERLCEVEDALTAAGQELGNVINVGRTTTAGNRTFYFYTANGAAAEECLTQAMTAFAEYEFKVGFQDDPQWSIYTEFLYPNDFQMKLIQNSRVLRQLEEAGDNFEIPRHVAHWIYFANAAGRDKFRQAVEAEGFELVEQHDQAEGDLALALCVRNMTTIDFPTIFDLVMELSELAEACQGEYDGWETSVERGE